MKKIRILTLIIATLLTFSLCSCIFQPEDTDGAQNPPANTTANTTASTTTPATTETDTNGDVITSATEDTTVEPDTNLPGSEETVEITASLHFSSKGCEISDTSTVMVSGKIYKIVKAGTYRISGTMEDGQIQVEVGDSDKVTLLLDNFDGKCSDSAVIYVINADKAYIDLEKGSVNTLTDATIYKFANPADDKPNACIYSADDLTIKGGGRLNVYANYNNGIGCKNDIDIKNGSISVKAVKNAIKGNDSVTVRGDAEVVITGAKDGVKTDNLEESGKGFVSITETAKVVVTCSDDAIQATQNVIITEDASVTVVAASSAVNCDGDTNIADGSLIIQ